MTSYLRQKAPGHGKRHRQKQRKRLAKRRVCGICGKGLNPSEASFDHIFPRSKGGCSEAWNLRATHPACNQARGSTLGDSADERTATFLHRAFGLSCSA